MSKEKQIEDMAKDIASTPIGTVKPDLTLTELGEVYKNSLIMRIAKHLYNADYRKQSEGEWVDQYNGKYDNPIYVCSVCRRGTLLKPYIDNLGNTKMEQALSEFCPRCGARMKG